MFDYIGNQRRQLQNILTNLPEPLPQKAQCRRLPDGKEFNLFVKNGKLLFDSTIPFEFFGGAIRSISCFNGKLAIKYQPLEYSSDSFSSSIKTLYVDEIKF